MRTEQNNQDLDRRVEQLLSPRFAPSAEEIKLSKPKRPTRRIWLNALRIGSVAAAVVAGIFVVCGPINTAEAKAPIDIISEALQEVQNAESLRVKFTAKVKPAPVNDNDYYRIEPDGEDVQGTMTLLKTNEQAIMRLEWESGVTQLYDGKRYYEWEGSKKVEDKECKIDNFKFLALADLEMAKMSLGGDIEIKEESDNKIRAYMDSPDYARVKERIEGIFSKKSGKLVGGALYEMKENERVALVKLLNVDYGFVISVDEITATPK